MKVLLVHNFYRQRGGEDVVFAEEGRLLESRGHDVCRYTAHNDDVDAVSRLALVGRTIWNRHAYRELRQRIARERPALVHVHNTLPLLSPSVYYAAHDEGIPVVQTVHNYRHVCPSSLLFRDGRVCTDCAGKVFPYPAIQHACYRGSRAASATVAAMLTVHRGLGSWRNGVDVYVAPTRLARDFLVAAGLPSPKIVVKPHFVDPDPGEGSGAGSYALFVGRLSVEKGVGTLLKAWQSLHGRMPLLVVGDGPMAPAVQAAMASMPTITWLGTREPAEIASLLRDARCLMFPSECLETFGRVIVEAFATGTPVLAAGHGAAAELVQDGLTGLHFRPGDASDLATKVSTFDSNPPMQGRMRTAARQAFETLYTADTNYGLLMDVYRRTIAAHAASEAVGHAEASAPQ